MRTTKLALAVIAMAALIQDPARAEGIAVGLGIGTVGPGAQVVFGVHERWNIRAGGSGFRLSLDYRESGVDYDATMKMANIPVIVDWFPAARFDLRVSAGLIGNYTRIDLEARPNSGQYEVGNNIYNANEIGRIDASARSRSIAPYLGVGWGNAVKAGKNWGWNVDVGLMYQGRAKTSYSVTCGTVQTNCVRLQNDGAIESAQFNRDVNDNRFYPVAQFWMSKQF